MTFSLNLPISTFGLDLSISINNLVSPSCGLGRPTTLNLSWPSIGLAHLSPSQPSTLGAR